MSRPLVLAGPAHPLRGGIAHFGSRLARALAEAHTVQRVSFSRQYPSFLFPGKSQLDPAPARPGAEEPGGATSPLIDSVAPWTWFSAARRVARSRPESAVLMHWTPFVAPAYAAFAAQLRRRCGARVVVLCHNLLPHEPGPLDRLLSRPLLAVCDGALVLSEQVESEVRSLAPALPLRRVRHPVVDVFPAPPSRAQARAALGVSDELVLLFFGLVRPYKGLEVLLRAMPEIARAGRCRLLVAGEFYEGRERYERLVAGLGVAERVTLIDRYVPDAEVPAYFAAADLCVQPYLSATQSGVSKLALLFGTPVLLTRVGGLAEDVVEGVTGYVVPPGDSGALAAAVLRFDRDRRSHDHRAAVASWRERFGWAPLVGALEELLA